MAWIGLLGAKAVAGVGVGVGGMFIWLSQGLAAMSRMGGQVHVAQCIGRGDSTSAQHYAQAAVQLSILMGLLFAAICVTFVYPLVGFFQLTDPEAHAADGFAAALNSFIAQNYGAEKNNRIRKGYLISLWMVRFWGLLVSALFLFFPRALAGIFFHEPAAIAIAVDYLLILSLCEPFMCVEFATVGALSGLGKTQLCGVLSIALTGIRIPIVGALSRSMGLNGIWWALTATSVVKGILFTGTFLYITRKKND